MSVAFLEHFADLPDPRAPRSRVHFLHDILIISLLAVLCGAEGWEEMAEWGQAKQEWLRQRLGLTLESGIPCPDTFRRVFARLDPERFDACFRAWVATLRKQTGGQVIALDGQVLRHSFDTALGQEAIHLVRAWATQERLVLGSVKVCEGSNEIPAVRALLAVLDLRGCIVTADAMHCQKETARQIVEQGGEYLLCLKDNHSTPREDISLLFERLDRHPAASQEWAQAQPGRAWSTFTEEDQGHGRQEVRRVDALQLAAQDADWQDLQGEWKDLRTLVRIHRIRILPDKRTEETHYYLHSGLSSARPLCRAVRRHWHIENRLHWVLDVSMGADASRVCRDHGPQNLALLRDMALNLLRQQPGRQPGVKRRLKRAGWEPDYLLDLLAGAG